MATYYKVFGNLKRPDGMSFEDFKKWWLEVHVLCVKKWPGMVAYDLNFALNENEPFDGVVVVWFDNKEAVLKVFQIPEGGRAHRRHRSCRRVYLQRLHVSSAVDRSIACSSQHPCPVASQDCHYPRRYPRGLEIRLDEPGHAAPDNHGPDLHVSSCALAGAAARVRTECAERRPDAIRPYAFSNRSGFDPRSIPARLHSILLSPSSPHSFGYVCLCRCRVAVQLFHDTRPEPHYTGGQRHILVSDSESEQHR